MFYPRLCLNTVGARNVWSKTPWQWDHWSSARQTQFYLFRERTIDRINKKRFSTEIGKLESMCCWNRQISQFLKSDQLLHPWGGVCPFSSPSNPPQHGSKSASLWYRLALKLCSLQSAAFCPCCSYLTGDIKGSCHWMLSWMVRPPGVFAWQEERTSTSPWPSPG